MTDPIAPSAAPSPQGVVEVGANQPLTLAGDDVWVVRQGALDVFVVVIKDGAPAGARRHVLRAEPGQAVFSAAATGDGLGLLAVGIAGTQVERLARGALTAPGSPHDVAGFVDGWVSGLSEGVTAEAPPRDRQVVQPGAGLDLAAGATVGAAAGVVWVSLTGATASFLGDAALPAVLGPEPLPLTPRTWLRARDAGKLVVLDTRACAEQGTLWSGLARLQALVLARLTLEAEQASRASQERVTRQAEADRRAMADAVRGLAGVFGRRRDAETLRDVTTDPMVRACRLVAEAAGIDGGGAAVRVPDSGEVRDRVAAIARALRFNARRVVLTGDWWRQDNGPLLGFRAEGGGPVALLPRRPGRYVLVDPTDATRMPVNRKVAGMLASDAYSLYRPFPDRPLSAWDVIRFGLRGARRDVTAVLVIGIVGGLLALLTPIATSMIFDTLIPSADRPRLLQMTLGLVIAALAAGVFEVTRSIALLRISGKVDASVQAATWDRLLNLPVPFFRGYAAGDLATRANAINTIQQTLTGVVISAVLSAAFSLFSFALLFYYSIRLALIAMAAVVVVVAVTGIANYFQLQRQRALLRVQGAIAGLVLQVIHGIAKLRVAGAEARAFAVWARAFAEQRRLGVRARALANSVAVFNAAWGVVASMVLFGAIAFWLAESLDTATFLAFYSAFGQFLAALMAMTGAITASLGVVPLYERARPILQTLPEVDRTRTDPGPLRGDVELSQVSFRYSADGPLALHDVSFRAKPGEFVALVGPSGSGKSTVFRLLLGFDAPEKGVVFYDGQDLAALDPRAVRRQIGVVLQQGRLMSGSIFQNIVGTAALTLDDAWEAARATGLDQDIQAMPMGMQTFISEGATTLSGGQRQRLMIARAIVTKPRILLFDEATSALDNETQAIVSRSVASLNATRIVIAHRLSTIMKAQRIHVLQVGRLVESGGYEELMARGGVFAALARRQLV